MRQKETNLKIIQERYNKRLERQKEYNKSKYDHLSIIVPSGSKDIVLKACKSKGFKNASDYFKYLLSLDGVFLDSAGGESVAPVGITEDKKPGFFETATNPQQDHTQI